jgi:arylsulfatase A-like enzyme
VPARAGWFAYSLSSAAERRPWRQEAPVADTNPNDETIPHPIGGSAVPPEPMMPGKPAEAAEATNAAEDSHDLLPLLKGEKESVRTTHVHNTYPNGYAIRHGKWTLIDAKTGYISGVDKEWEKRHGYKPDDKVPVELYDMEKDIGQKNNLAEEHPEIVKELQNLLKKIREQGHSAPRFQKE